MRAPALLALSFALGAACAEAGPDAPWLTALDRQTHEPEFPIAAGAHAGAGCNDCHGEYDTFARFTCLGCHVQAQTDPRHAGVGGYAWASEKCLECHPRGEALSVDHAKYFPIAAPARHAGLACAECHTDPSNRKVQTCNACHSHPASAMAARHGRVGGFDTASAKCLRCHADAQVDRVAAHLPFVIASGDHYRAPCLVCHPATRADKPWGADFRREKVNCLFCHAQGATSAEHDEVSGFRYESLACLSAQCHPDGRKHED